MIISCFLFYLLLGLTISDSICLVIGICRRNEDSILGSVLFLLFIGCGGWGMLGYLIPQKSESISVSLNILSNETMIIGLDEKNEVVYKSSNVSDWRILSDKESFPFIKTVKINMYGVENSVTYELKIEK